MRPPINNKASQRKHIFILKKATNLHPELSYVMESARQAQKLSQLRISQRQPRDGSTPSLQSFTAKAASSSTTLLSVQLARTASGSQQAAGLAKRTAKGLKWVSHGYIALSWNELAGGNR